MVHLASSQPGSYRSACLPVSLWQGTELIGWFRGKDIDQSGMLVTGPVDKLKDNSIITVSLELKRQNAIITQVVKALVVHPKHNGVELWWADQHAGLPSLMADASQQIT